MLCRGITRHALGCGRNAAQLTPLSSRLAIVYPISHKLVFPKALPFHLRQTRGIETESHTPASAHSILVSQRKNRPVSPHLSIYRLQINYFTSPFHRITGCLVSGTFYVFGASYLIAPLFGWHLDSASLAAAFGSLSPLVKSSLKFAIAWPFTFHCVNGVGHLIWDTGRRFGIRQIVRQGWTVVGVSLGMAGYLAWFV